MTTRHVLPLLVVSLFASVSCGGCSDSETAEAVGFAVNVLTFGLAGAVAYLELSYRDQFTKTMERMKVLAERNEVTCDKLTEFCNAMESQSRMIKNLADTVDQSMTGVTRTVKDHMQQSAAAWQLHMGGQHQ